MNNLLSERSKELLKKENSFDSLRYFFTISVLIGHFYILTGTEQSWFISGATGIKTFFIMSGFLVFYSYIKKEDLKQYIKKRIRRILPPYVLVVILCTLIGIWLTALSIPEYITSKETYRYLVSNLTFLNFIQPTLPGVFQSNPIPAVNGSLWTMKVEVMFYISVPIILYLLKKYNKLYVMIGIFLLSIAYIHCFTLLYELTNKDFYLLIRKQIGSQLIYFYSGTFILLYFDRFIKYFKYFFSIALVIYILDNNYSNILLSSIEPLAFATLLIGLAYHMKYLHFLRKYDNVSYGMYLYHYPIIQIIIYYRIPEYNIYLAFSLVMLLTIAVSVLSYKLIEKPIIQGKIFKIKKQVTAL